MTRIVSVIVAFLISFSAHAELTRFAKVSPGIYRGSRPESKTDFDMLKRLGIRVIVDLEILPWNQAKIDRMANDAGIRVIHADFQASPIPPSRKSVFYAVRALGHKGLRPVYVHCKLGRDRTGLVIGLYRVFYENWTPDMAYDEMLKFGFSEAWHLRGLRAFFWNTVLE